MGEEAEGFLARIREVPDDDGPRLIYADWLDEQDDPRGEFIRVQVALARMPATDRRRPGLLRIERDLVGRYGEQWAAPFRGLATGPVFRRGFVDEVKVTARQFLARGPALFAVWPFRRLHLLDLGGHLDAVLTSPLLARLTGLTVYAQHLGEPLARSVADSPHLVGLTELRLGRNRVGDPGAERVAASRFLARLEVLDLSENELGPAAGGVLTTAGVRELNLGQNRLGDAGVARLADQPAAAGLRALRLDTNGLTDAGLEALARSPHLTRLVSLDVSGNAIGDAGFRALLASESLRTLRQLAFTEPYVSDRMVREL
ncbi:MAG TPA: TIGR02996 domain-containing protein, partial [Fimbriiglobus sp.]|nr:TIGR02996 domain-containing protein [Fimbriiglobus sp.]